jgi:hypothetical protein
VHFRLTETLEGFRSAILYARKINFYCAEHVIIAAPTRPFTWKEIDAKFDKLAAGHATEKSREKIKNAVRSLDDIQGSDLMEVLSPV